VERFLKLVDIDEELGPLKITIREKARATRSLRYAASSKK
jgi:hypothetical protein